MAANHGTLREEEMVYHLDQKRVKDLNSNLYCLMQELYGVLDEEEIITAHRIGLYGEKIWPLIVL